jgi:hypothetical protein
MIKKILLFLLEMNSKTIFSKTGQKAPYSGLYRSGDDIIALTKGEKFPPSLSSKWKLITNI